MFDVYQTVQRHWRSQRDPVYRAERRPVRPGRVLPALRRAWSRLGPRLGLVSLIVLGLGVCRVGIARGVVMLLLASLALVMGLAVAPYVWRIPAAAACAPLIVRERERRTWDALAVIPASVRDILLAKLAAALQPLHGLLGYVMLMRLLVSLPAVAAGLYVTLQALGPQPTMGVLAAGLLPLACTGYFLLEPNLDLLVDGAVGLVASAYSPSAAQAIPLAVMLRLALWLLHLLALVPAAALLHGVGLDAHLLGQLPLLALLGPGLGYLTDFPAWAVLLWMAVLLPLRLLWLEGLVWAAVRRSGG